MMARKVKRIKDLRIEEASLVDTPANPLAQVVLYKRDGLSAEEHAAIAMAIAEVEESEMSKVMKQDLNQLEWDALIAERCGQLAPDLSVGEALMAFLGKDAVLDGFYQRYLTSHPADTVQKSAELPGDKAWALIEKAARSERRPNESLPQARARLLDENPGLYEAWQTEAAGDAG